MNRQVLSLILVCTVFLSLLLVPTYAVTSIATLSSGCSDLKAGQCHLRFFLASTVATDSIETPNWGPVISSVENKKGSCIISGSTLQLNAQAVVKGEPLSAHYVECIFNIVSGGAAPKTNLGEVHHLSVLPALAYSYAPLGFLPYLTSSCKNPKALDDCQGVFSFGSDTLPLSIKTTSALSLTNCYVQGESTSDQTYQIRFDNMNQDGVNTYTLLRTIDLPTFPSAVQCQLAAAKNSFSPYFIVSRNDNELYRSQEIILQSVETIFTASCYDHSNPMCGLIFRFPKKIPDASDISVTTDNFFYTVSLLPFPDLCAIFTEAYSLDAETSQQTCLLVRKPYTFTDPEAQRAQPRVIPWISTGSTKPVVTIALQGKWFSGQYETHDVASVQYDLPVRSAEWDQLTCNDPNIPVCTVRYNILHIGAPTRFKLTAIPFSGLVDHYYCETDNGKALIHFDPKLNSLDLNDYGRVVLPTAATFAFGHFCTVAYSLQADYVYDDVQGPQTVGVKSITETLGSVSVNYDRFEKVSLPRISGSNVKFTNIPLGYTLDANCSSLADSLCTINFDVVYDSNYPLNFIRSFEVIVPFPSANYLSQTVVLKDFQVEFVGFSFQKLSAILNTFGETVSFAIQIDHGNVGQYLYGTDPGKALYGTAALQHTVKLTYSKNVQYANIDENNVNLFIPQLTSWNNIPATTKPARFNSAPADVPPIFYFPIWYALYNPQCASPTSMHCISSFVRRPTDAQVIENRYFATPNIFPDSIYFTQETWEEVRLKKIRSTNPGVATAMSGLPIYDPVANKTIISYVLNLRQLDLQDLEVLPLHFIKPFGDTDNITLGSLDPFYDPTTQRWILKNRYEYLLHYSYTSDAKVSFNADCGEIFQEFCTLSWQFNSAVPTILNPSPGYDILVQHKIPTYVPTPAFPSSLSKLLTMPPADLNELILGRLILDWTPQNGFIKEVVSPVVCTGQTKSYPAWLAIQSEAAQSGTESPDLTSLPVQYDPGIATSSTNNPSNEILYYAHLENIEGKGSFISLRSIITGAQACAAGCPDGQLPHGIRVPLEQDDNKITCKVTLSKWNGISSRFFITPRIVNNVEVPHPERVSPSPVPAIYYSPVEIEPSDDCINSWKTGSLTCTFAGVTSGSLETPLSNYVYASSVVLREHELIPAGEYFLFTEPIHPENQAPWVNSDKHVMTLRVDYVKNTVIVIVRPAFRTGRYRSYLVLVDSPVNAVNRVSLLNQPPRVLTNLFTPTYPNFYPGDDADFDVIAQNIQLYREGTLAGNPVGPLLLAIPNTPQPLQGLPLPPPHQTTFFPIPAIVTGPPIQVYSSRGTFRIPGDAPVEFSLNVPISGSIQFSTNLGIDSPYPCYNTTGLATNFNNLPMSQTVFNDSVNRARANLKWKSSTTDAEWLQAFSSMALTFNQTISGWLMPVTPQNKSLRLIPVAENFIATEKCFTYIPVNTHYPSNFFNIRADFLVTTLTYIRLQGAPEETTQVIGKPFPLTHYISFPRYVSTQTLLPPASKTKAVATAANTQDVSYHYDPLQPRSPQQLALSRRVRFKANVINAIELDEFFDHHLQDNDPEVAQDDMTESKGSFFSSLYSRIFS